MVAANITYKDTNLEDALTWIDWKSLSLYNESGMKNIITKKDERFDHKNIRVCLAFHDKEVVGWAWSLPYNNYNGNPRRGFMVYVKGGYRRQKIGSYFVSWGKSVAKSSHKKFMCFPWDNASEEFYDSQGIKIKNQGWWLPTRFKI